MNSDRGKLLRMELTGLAHIDQPALDASSVDALMELIVEPSNLERAWRRVKRNRGAPGPDGITIKEFEPWVRTHWELVRQQLLDGTYRPGPVRRKTIRKEGGGERLLAGTDRRLVAKRA
jgi:RNA-directed DNA polymerase